MGISNVFDVTGTALNVQSIHMDIIAQNMANVEVVSGSEESAFKARRPVFATMLSSSFNQNSTNGVKVDGMSSSQAPVEKQRMPGNPMADEDGYVYLSNVNMVEEMAYMMQASRSYQANIEVLNTSKQLMIRTLSLGS